MGLTNNIADLPWRRDLDQRVAVSPDEAGRFDQWLQNDGLAGTTSAQFWADLQNELDLICDSGLPSGAEVLEIEYGLAANERSAYEARVVGYPPNSDALSKWTVYFYVKE
jgi:hypothetical protein